MAVKPKIENANIGFHYTVTDEQIKAHQQKSVEEILEWIEETSKFIYEIQTPEERLRTKLAKQFNNNAT
ncbi:MAG: hypothetical protein HY062_08195 [Bacteroidetes bacterium]|nr:hypothetical protein [Bacteroidota bacterium]